VLLLLLLLAAAAAVALAAVGPDQVLCVGPCWCRVVGGLGECGCIGWVNQYLIQGMMLSAAEEAAQTGRQAPHRAPPSTTAQADDPISKAAAVLCCAPVRTIGWLVPHWRASVVPPHLVRCVSPCCCDEG